jgi:hypothetical protein
MSFECEICGKKLPDNDYWFKWSILIGEICRECQLDKIREGK